jgi:acetoin utilization deacetylase AcuC-like enzyme
MILSRRTFLNDLSKGVFLAGAAYNLGCSITEEETPKAGPTGYVYDDKYLEHPHDAEMPERLVFIQQHMQETGLAKEVVGLDAIEDPYPHIKKIHSEDHVQSVMQISRTGPVAGLAAAGALGAVDAVCRGKVRNAFCAIRPPGHHAHNSGREEGFCFYGNVAVAAAYARDVHGLKKVLIIDWDYHHGNGTEWAFYNDPGVLFFSTHDWQAYPGTGDPERKGEGQGYGYNINVHLDCGTGDDTICRAFDEQLLPAAEAFKPDLVLISAGFDSKRNDLLGCFDITPAGFSKLTRKAMDIAEASADGRLVSLLEGGYADADNRNSYTFYGLAAAVAAHVGTLISGEA